MTDPLFDPVIHAPNRLQICAFLVPLEDAEFQVIREELGVSDSVLSKHIKQLVEAGYVKLRKNNMNGRQRTWARLSREGRDAFARHIEELRRLAGITDTTATAGEPATPTTPAAAPFRGSPTHRGSTPAQT